MDGSHQLFDASWDSRATHEGSASYWSDKARVASITVLKRLCDSGGPVEFAVEPPGVSVCRIPDQNIAVNVLDPSGLCSRRGDAYSIGDIIVLLCIRRAEYTYSAISQRGFKYVNVLERDRIKSLLADVEIPPDLLEAKVRYVPLNEEPGGDTSGRQDDNGELEPPQGRHKQLISDVLKLVDEQHNELKKHGLSEDSEDYKNARKKYRNTCVFATTLIERPLRSRTAVVTAHGETFERILQKLDGLQSKKPETKKRPTQKTIGNVLRTNSKLRVLDEICCKYRKKPVIIVPSSTMSILSRQNIKQLLEDHHFVDPMDSLRDGGPVTSALPMNAVEVVHTIRGRPIKFRVVENSYTSKFTASDWISVVCVILNLKGGQWQFNGYPFESFVDMFMTMKGALFTYDTDSIPAEMGNWDLKVGNLCCSLKT
ncbi:RNA polymerase II accessory factor CDC73 [Babesia ovis]|uniref:RNA polymerase II accessory factor CDC73 n=1 Tax=Babesia ovis TaxID=5869 RepID=A0A9W5TC11_BABOV|nr:RNA polymerase II accessory factor CDC73 [Babesia ovis]